MLLFLINTIRYSIMATVFCAMVALLPFIGFSWIMVLIFGMIGAVGEADEKLTTSNSKD